MAGGGRGGRRRGPLAAWLTWDVPAAIVGDTPRCPPRPRPAAGRGWLGKLFGAT